MAAKGTAREQSCVWLWEGVCRFPCGSRAPTSAALLTCNLTGPWDCTEEDLRISGGLRGRTALWQVQGVAPCALEELCTGKALCDFILE